MLPAVSRHVRKMGRLDLPLPQIFLKLRKSHLSLLDSRVARDAERLHDSDTLLHMNSWRDGPDNAWSGAWETSRMAWRRRIGSSAPLALTTAHSVTASSVWLLISPTASPSGPRPGQRSNFGYPVRLRLSPARLEASDRSVFAFAGKENRYRVRKIATRSGRSRWLGKEISYRVRPWPYSVTVPLTE